MLDHSDVRLPPLDPNRPPWPGAPVLLDGRATYVRHTPGGPGAEPALYVHGLGGSSTNWTDLAGLLADRLEGSAPDLPGFGLSDPAPPDGYSLPALADRLARLIEHEGRRPVHLFGNSLGGGICVALAAARPDLVRTLTLISPAMPDLSLRWGPDVLTGLVALPGARVFAERRFARLSPLQRAQGVIDVCFADPTRVPPKRLAEAAEEVRQRDALPWAMESFIRSLRGLLAGYFSPGSRGLWQLARRVAAPTLVVWGRADQLVSVRLAERTARAIPDSRLLLLDGVGHTAQLEAPREVARAVLRFLDEPHGTRGAKSAPRRHTPYGP